ncbi:MAG: right-handed parallel beta-helix repeat-containing protein, partial [Actinomycetes bacterium]
LPVPRKYGTIQGAIRAAADGDTVVVAPGSYKENLDFQGKRITVRSEDPQSASVVGATIIEGNGPAPTVAFTRGEPKDAALKGFTIRNSSGRSGIHVSCSSPTIVRNVISGLQGSGIQISPPEPQGQATAPLIMANTISDNLGGIVMRWASPVLSDNAITRNRQSGIFMWWSHPLVSDNRIEENSSRGIFVDHYSQPVIKGNLVSGNTEDSVGAGIQLDDSCHAIIDGNMIVGNVSNTEGGGLSMILDCYPQVTNNVFANNSGGAIFANCAQPQIINNTFVGNRIVGGDSSRVTITNSILFDSDIIPFDDCSEWVMTYSIDNRFQREGEGNLFCDPLFAGENDYHLLAASPAIDAGTAVDLQTDIEGTTRPQGGGYDIGAYEYVSGR